MSRETLEAIDAAVKAHAAEVDEEGLVVNDWVIAYTGSHLVPNEEEGGLTPCFDTSYATSELSNPMSTMGLAAWLDTMLKMEVTTGDDDE